MNLTKTSAWSLGTTGLCVALAAGSWFLLIEPERADAAGLRESTVAAQQSNAELEVRVEQLRAEYAELPARQAELAAIRQALPDEPALAQLIRELSDAGVDAGITVDAITAGAVTAVIDGTAVTAVPDTDAGQEPNGDPSAEPSAEPSTEPSTTDPGTAADPAAVADPAVLPSGPVLASVAITVQSEGDFQATNLFLTNVQTRIDRAFLVDGLALTVLDQVTEGGEAEEVGPGQITGTLTGRVFVFVDPASVAVTPNATVPAATS